MDGLAVRHLRFVWWNVQSFGHYDTAWVADPRLPRSAGEYTAKRVRVAAALRAVLAEGGLDLIALAEITCEAAADLAQDVCPGFKVFAIDDLYQGRPTFQVAILYDPNAGPIFPDLFAPIDISDASRAMAVVEYRWATDLLRVYACHFTAQIGGEISLRNRSEMARQLNRHAYEFLQAGQGQAVRRHVLILGDLNEEPFGLLEEDLFARRDRRWVRTTHPADVPIRRARLYKCAWRLLGERLPHPSVGARGHAAGTYYSRDRNRWYTWDHVLVSGSLLTEDAPFLDEESVEVVCGPELIGDDGRPAPFSFRNGRGEGLSDHLPVRGRLVLA